MNAYETWFCGSRFWRWMTRRHLLPWMVEGSELGDQVLELGAGLGATTQELAGRAARVTSLEYNHNFAAQLGARVRGSSTRVIQADAASLPLADATFSSAIAILMLHHLRSSELQNQAFAEIARVLRPGGVFLAFEIQDGWLHRVGHIRSTFVPLDPRSVHARLILAGFSQCTIAPGQGGFRIRGIR